MEPTDLTIRILQEIRDENRGMRADLPGLRADVSSRFDGIDQRSLAIESTLKELAEQMVMLARGVTTALEVRLGMDRRLEEREPH